MVHRPPSSDSERRCSKPKPPAGSSKRSTHSVPSSNGLLSSTIHPRWLTRLPIAQTVPRPRTSQNLSMPPPDRPGALSAPRVAGLSRTLKWGELLQPSQNDEPGWGLMPSPSISSEIRNFGDIKPVGSVVTTQWEPSSSNTWDDRQRIGMMLSWRCCPSTNTSRRPPQYVQSRRTMWSSPLS